MSTYVSRRFPWFLVASLAIACTDSNSLLGSGASDSGGATDKDAGDAMDGGSSDGALSTGDAGPDPTTTDAGLDAAHEDGATPPDDGAPADGNLSEGGSDAAAVDDAGDGGEAGGPGDSGDATVEPDLIDNADFEAGDLADIVPPAWTLGGASASSGAALIKWNQAEAHGGQKYLNLWLDSAYTVNVSQLVSPLPNGNYSLRIWHYGGSYTEQYLWARGYDASNPSAELHQSVTSSAGWEELTLANIAVTSGQVEIGIYSDGAADSWSHFDDVILTRVE